MSIPEHRQAIDKLDEQLVRLLSERTRHVLAIGEIKLAAGQEIYAPHREQAVLDRVARLNPGPMTAEQIQAIYREIMSGALALEKTMRIACLGPLTNSSYHAAVRRFGASLQYSEQRTIPDVFSEVAAGRADYGVAPMENPSEGLVARTLEMFIETDLKIVSQVILSDSEAKAARFCVLGRQCSPPTGHDRTSMIFSLADKPGALCEALARFRRNQINLTKIESRPAGRTGSGYYFYTDCDGHAHDKKMARAIRNFSAHCHFIKILGSYPNAK